MSDKSYKISNVNGMKNPLYDFKAPPEYLDGTLSFPGVSQRQLLIYYFIVLYPLSDSKTWYMMSTDELLNYYRGLDYWYVFNTYWGVSPMPITLDSSVVSKWEKCTFYQPGTIIQSSINYCSWEQLGTKRYYFASRLNNAAQVDSSYTYTLKNGVSRTVRRLVNEEEYWNEVPGSQMEITSWGWNPYPYGIYLQGPYRGSGNFVYIPKDTIVCTSRWEVIWRCKADDVSNELLWSEMINHELGRVTKNPNLWMGHMNVNPWFIVSGKWATGFYTPLLLSYSLFLIGGFGGLGDPFLGVDGPFWGSWGGDTPQSNYQYAPVLVLNEDGSYTMPLDQSVNNVGGFSRSSQSFWSVFNIFFINYLCKWGMNWAEQMWRYPIFYSGTSGGEDIYEFTTPCTANPCDDLVVAMISGNFDITKYSPMGSSKAPSYLSRFSGQPAVWSHICLSNGQIIKNDGKTPGYPTGILIKTIGYKFVIATQMPNANGDIGVEFTDIRVMTPGNLGDGSGDQSFWKDMLSYYCSNYMFTIDPFGVAKPQSFQGQYEPWFPDVTLTAVKVDVKNWKPQENVAIGKAFFNFDILSGKWTGGLSYTGKDPKGIYKAFDQYPIFQGNGNLELTGTGYTACKDVNSTSNILPTPSSNFSEVLGGSLSCYEGKGYTCNSSDCSMFTLAGVNDQYFPNAVDSFQTGVVGFQANGSVANIGSCQTRWGIGSKGIGWTFDAPAANRVIIKKGASLIVENGDNNNSTIIWIISTIIFMLIMLMIHKYLSKLTIFLACVMFAFLYIVITNMTYQQNYIMLNSQEGHILSEQEKLILYFHLVYPMVPISRWKSMTIDQLRKFFCSFHLWFKGDGLPSPLDYIKTSYWSSSVPFGPSSSWKNFTTRKRCVTGSPQSYNPYDGKLCIGWDNLVGTSQEDTPTGILFRGRQLLCMEAGVQQTTFFEPSYNFWIDNYNAHASVNNTDINAWQNVQFVEVSSQWGPFPDGSYYDWAPGSGVWLKLDKHIVGYTGLDVVRRAGLEMMENIQIYYKKLENIYFQMWQRTGLDGITMDGNGNIVLPKEPQCYTCSLYGSIILTTAQWNQFNKLPLVSGQGWYQYDVSLCADGTLFKRIYGILTTAGITFKYYDAKNGTWVTEMPTDQGHVQYYPFPLPFGSGAFISGVSGMPFMNPYALNMPWEYQMFNIANMTRQFCVDAIFLNPLAIPINVLQERGVDVNYTDLLMANKTNPPQNLLNWQDALTVIINIISQPITHPFLSKFGRFPEISTWDGPMLILTDETNWGQNPPTIGYIQTGALDKKKYIQDIITNKGVNFVAPSQTPQALAANLEIDHWMSTLSQMLGYNTSCRINHWCGNKSIAFDIEIIHFGTAIAGNLIDNTLSTNIYEVWNGAFKDGTFSSRDPFVKSNLVYPDIYDSIITLENQGNSQNSTWARPPWIGYNPSENLYGWPCESLFTNWYQNLRLSYCNISTEDTSLSNSYPEYNKYIWNHFATNYNLVIGDRVTI